MSELNSLFYISSSELLLRINTIHTGLIDLTPGWVTLQGIKMQTKLALIVQYSKRECDIIA